jgi:site-specific DNA-cytosine methylase
MKMLNYLPVDRHANHFPWEAGILGVVDKRNMFPEMIQAVREIRPKVVLIENVKGLLRGNSHNE